MMTLKELIGLELDRVYNKTIAPVLRQVQTLSQAQGSPMQKALAELDEMAADADKIRVAELGQVLKTYNDTTNQTAALLMANDVEIQTASWNVATNSTKAKIFQGASTEIIEAGGNPIRGQALNDMLIRQGITVRTPDIVKDYVNSAAWAEKMAKWGDGYARLTRDTLINGIGQGWGPGKIASAMRQHAENMPYHAADNLARTLSVTSYREASLAMEEVNGGFIEKKTRIAKLDSRTCAACIALHGTELAPGERVDDHYRGRCSEFYVVPGGPRVPGSMQADSEPGKRRFTDWQTGEEWFAGLPESRQRQQASFLKSPAKFRAYQDGMPLSQLVGDHNDPVFGNQKIELSLIKALGDKAEDYYG